MRTLLVAAALLAAACTEPTIPDRPLSYSFADTLIGPPDPVVVFRWTEAHLPVRFYADTASYMRTILQRAIDAWEAQFLYGEFRGVLVNDSTDADVIVRWSGAPPPNVAPDTSTTKVCQGNSPYLLAAGQGVLGDSALHLELSTLNPSWPPAVAACMRRAAIHEVGHVLGLQRESTFPTNIMNPNLTVNLPNDGDRRTIEVLYHTRPTLFPRPR